MRCRRSSASMPLPCIPSPCPLPPCILPPCILASPAPAPLPCPLPWATTTPMLVSSRLPAISAPAHPLHVFIFCALLCNVLREDRPSGRLSATILYQDTAQ